MIGFHAFPNWIRGGFIGVDIFFVISGFLISSIIFDGLAHDNFSFGKFYGRRIRRIFPALIMVLIASFAIGWQVLLPDDYKELGEQIAGGAGFVSNFVLWNESGYFDTAAAVKPLLHLWSLGIEEQFYIVWPSLLWLAWKWRLNLFAVTLIIAALSFALNVASVGHDAAAAFYSPLTRTWELMTGALIAFAAIGKPAAAAAPGQPVAGGPDIVMNSGAPDHGAATRHNLLSIAGAVAVVASVLLITRDLAFPGWWAAPAVIGTALMISAGANAWLNRVILSNRTLVWVGLISYPLYLWHWPLLSFQRIVEGETPSPGMRVAAVAVSIVLAGLTYWLIEKPIRFGARARAKTAILAVLMAVAGIIGIETYAGNGLPFRLPLMVQELTQYKYEILSLYRSGTCFLRDEQVFADFASCETTGKRGGPSILIWGDSHAAQLYPGYEAAFGDEFSIVQRTSSACPPILNMEIANRPNCKRINDLVFMEMMRLKPHKVVLAANWEYYLWPKIAPTIAVLRKIGIDHIDLIGPVPHWNESLPQMLYLRYKADPLHRIPMRMNSGLDQDNVHIEVAMADFASHTAANYVSPMKIMCDAAGCLTRLGNTGDSLTAWDESHLTEKGAKYLVSRFPRD